MSSSKLKLIGRNPMTGMSTGVITSNLDARQVAELLSITGYAADKLAEFAVEVEGTEIPAEQWCEENPVEVVKAAWKAGSGLFDERQRQLHEWWPALAMALDNLEENHAEA